jgi:surfeit locus 1 family protein
VTPARRWRGWLFGIAALLGIATAVSLGLWQWNRGQQRLALQAAIAQRQALPPVTHEELLRGAGSPQLLHRPVTLRGEWLAPYTVYLDNRQMRGRPGFYVITPLRLSPPSASSAVVLVERGWVARNFVDRAQLPPVETPVGEVIVQGRIAPAPAKLYDFGGSEAGPIRQNLDLAAFRRETGLPLIDGSVQQTGQPSQGLLRDWTIPAAAADKNFGYAFQWWALGGLIFILYVWFQFISPRRRSSGRA